MPNARLEFCCKDVKVNVNFCHDLGIIPRKKQLKLSVDSVVLKKNGNSLLNFGKELKPILKLPELKPKRSKTLQQMKRVRLKKQPLILKEAKNAAQDAKRAS